MYRYVKRILQGISLRLFIEILLFLGSVIVFAFIANEIVLQNEKALDDWGFSKVKPLVSPGMTSFMKFMTFFGYWYFVMPAFLILIAWFLIFKKNTNLSMDVTAIGITSTALLFTVKHIFRRERPADPLLHSVSGFSFPSGHSFFAFTFFGLLIYIVADLKMPRSRKWILSIFFFLFACLVAISRVYLRVHYTSDIIGGFLLSILWLSISFWVLHIIRGKKFFDR